MPIPMRHLVPALLGTIVLLTSQINPTAAQAAPELAAQDRLWNAAMAGDTLALAQAVKDGGLIDSLDVRRSPNGRRALNWAAWYEHPETIRWLVAHGANLKLTNRTGFTPLHHAAENGSLDAARVLVEVGADRAALNNAGETPAEVARRTNHEVIAGVIEAADRKRP